MKRNILIIIMTFFSLVSMADKTVILDSKGKATAFSDLVSAVNASVDGDVIYLADYTTYDCKNGLLITHLIQIRGYRNSKINGDVTISIDGMPDMKEPVLEGVEVNGTVFVMKSVNNFKLRHCQFSNIQFAAPQPNGLIDRCYAENVFNIPPVSDNFNVRNTKINTLKSAYMNNTSTHFLNCNIYQIYCEQASGVFVNCLINSGYDNRTYPLKNSVLVSCCYRWDSLSIDGESTTTIDCSGADGTIMNWYCDTYVDYYRGDDGTVMGITGGATPFTLTPAVMPKVTNLSANTSDGVVKVAVRATSNDKQNN